MQSCPCGGGGGGAVEEVSGGPYGANPQLQLHRPVLRQDPQEGVNRFGGGDKADGPQFGEGQLQLVPEVRGPPLLAESTRTRWFPHVNVGEGGGGVQTLCPLHHLPHQQASCVCGLVQRVRAAGEGQEVGVGVSGWVWEAAVLRESHCKRKESCTGEQKHG